MRLGINGNNAKILLLNYGLTKTFLHRFAMKRKRLLIAIGLWLTLILICECTGDDKTPRSAYDKQITLADSIRETSLESGRYSLVSEFFENLAIIRQTAGAESAYSVLFAFFNRLHPSVRIADSLAVLQSTEWMANCFTMMDSGGIFFTNGDLDTYAAWYLQRVEHLRQDLNVISLPFLMGPDYRRFLFEDSRIRQALNLSKIDDLSQLPSTGETQDALQEMIARSVSEPEHPPVYLAPRCGIADRFGGHIVDLGLVHAYQDSVLHQTHYLDLLVSKLTRDWGLQYASQGAPKDSSYAARVSWLQYLTLLIRMAPEFEKAKRRQELDTLFVYLEPVVGEDWRFYMLRYMHCHQDEDQCLQYLKKVEGYAADHPDDRAVQGALQQLKGNQGRTD
jgi:hypothetical protein